MMKKKVYVNNGKISFSRFCRCVLFVCPGRYQFLFIYSAHNSYRSQVERNKLPQLLNAASEKAKRIKSTQTESLNISGGLTSTHIFNKGVSPHTYLMNEIIWQRQNISIYFHTGKHSLSISDQAC